MKVAALIVEYNPLHNGHLWQIAETRKLVGTDGAIIAVMSGNFCQRGSISCLDKFTKANLAVELGVDLVIELPTLAVLASADTFGRMAVSIINSLGICDLAVVGVESTNFALLHLLAGLLTHFLPSLGLQQKQEFVAALPLADKFSGSNSDFLPSANKLTDSGELTCLTTELSSMKATFTAASQAGCSYQQALTQALSSETALLYINNYLSKKQQIGSLTDLAVEINELLTSPNNILALSYLRAEKELANRQNIVKSWRLHFLPRQSGSNFASAHKIRALLTDTPADQAAIFSALYPYLPAKSLTTLLTAAKQQRLMLDNQLLVHYLTAWARNSCLKENTLPEEALWQRLDGELSENLSLYCQTEKLDELLAATAHKSLSKSHIRRALLRNFLGIPEYTNCELNRLSSQTPYLRILAFSKKKGRYLLKLMHKQTTIPLISRSSDFYAKQNYNGNKEDFYRFANIDRKAANIYAVLSRNSQALEQNQYR